VFLILRKALFPAEFMKFKAYVELQTSFRIIAIRIDRAKENYTLSYMLKELGIAVEYTTAYTLS
jgi:hypothetical protein